MKQALIYFEQAVQEFREHGTYKEERIITTPQGGRIDTTAGRNVLNMCANNYLGLASSRALADAAKDAMDRWGYGLSSVRFICGTQALHRQLEEKLSSFLGMEDTILYSSCFDANGGLFEALLDERDAVISDALNHASIIDGVRLCKAKRYRYQNNDMADLERCLREAKDARIRLIATDGVFSMDGIIANLKGICGLAEKYDALVMVDDSHAVGFIQNRKYAWKALEQLFTVGALTEVQKRRFRLHVFQGLSTRQIGRMEGTSHQAVAKSINLAIAKLKKYFAAQG